MIKLLSIFYFIYDLQFKFIFLIEMNPLIKEVDEKNESSFLKKNYENSLLKGKINADYFENISIEETKVYTSPEKQAILSSVGIMNGIFKKDFENFENVEKKMDFNLEEYNIVPLHDKEEEKEILEPESTCNFMLTSKKEINNEDKIILENEVKIIYTKLNLTDKFTSLSDFTNFMNYISLEKNDIEKELLFKINFINTFIILNEDFHHIKLSTFYLNNLLRNMTHFIDNNINKFSKNESYIKYLLYSTNKKHVHSLLNFLNLVRKENMNINDINNKNLNLQFFDNDLKNIKFEFHLIKNNYFIKIFYGEKEIEYLSHKKIPFFKFRRRILEITDNLYVLFCLRGLEYVDLRMSKKKTRGKLSYIVVAIILGFYTIYQRLKVQKLDREKKLKENLKLEEEENNKTEEKKKILLKKQEKIPEEKK